MSNVLTASCMSLIRIPVFKKCIVLPSAESILWKTDQYDSSVRPSPLGFDFGLGLDNMFNTNEINTIQLYISWG